MVIKAFPPVELADEYGLLAVGGDLEIPSLLLAYRSGIFPWPMRGEKRIPWFAPPKRALIYLNEFSPPRSLIKASGRFELGVNLAFPQVVRACGEFRQGGTWITEEIEAAYLDLYTAGFAHSVESYLNGELVGGVYGVSIGGLFTGESMFYRESNASKVALWALIEFLKAQGVPWIDCQVMNPHLASLGAVEIPRAQFMEMLAQQIAKGELEFKGSTFRRLLPRSFSVKE
jgi:leucyl/phenylalanyl-tRNA--protein transferase